MIVALLTFHPRQKNPARASGFGQWRVADCFDLPAVNEWNSPHVSCRLLAVDVDRHYKKGSRVDPKALALRGLAAAQTVTTAATVSWRHESATVSSARKCERCGTAYFPPYPAECDWCPGMVPA